MLFPTVEFGLFFVAVFALAWGLGGRFETRKWLLLAASYAFYAFWDWRFVALLAASSLAAYWAGRAVAAARSDRAARRIVAASVTAHLGVLAAFKYFEFFLENLGSALAQVGWERDLPIFEVLLPIGISFFTFQAISYVIDVYRRKMKPVEDPLDLFLFISFFPQLVAGPIVRAADFLPQLRRPPQLDMRAVAIGFALIVSGLFKKVFLAAYISADLVDVVFSNPAAYSSLDLAIAAYGYAVQVYCDFSAYSDIAIGAALLLGYRFKRNFDRPLAATSLEQLWRRWHISLSSFLRDYLYKNLRGARGGGRLIAWRTTFLTMVIGGLWHGAAWTFVIWGAIHGAFLVAEKAAKAQVKDVRPLWMEGPLGAVLGWAFAFHVFAFAAIFFRAPELAIALEYLDGLAALTGGLAAAQPFVVGLIAFAVLIQCAPKDMAEKIGARSAGLHWAPAGAALGLAIVAIYKLSPPGLAPFIYFQF